MHLLDGQRHLGAPDLDLRASERLARAQDPGAHRNHANNPERGGTVIHVIGGNGADPVGN